MADIERRGSYSPRKTREDRAFKFVVVGGATGAMGALGLVLAVFGVVGAGIPILLLIVAAVCAFLFRRTVSR